MHLETKAWLIAIGAFWAATVSAQHTVFVHRGILDDPATAGTGTAFKEVELADLDADGRLDLVLPQKQPIIGAGPNNDILYHSTGGDLVLAIDPLGARYVLVPTAQAFVEPNPGNPLMTQRTYDVELADFDGDGALDILRPDRDGRVDVWWGHIDSGTGLPDGTFRDRTDVLADFGPNPNQGCGNGIDGNYDDVDIADLDGDGDLDFVVAQRQTCTGGLTATNVLVASLASQGQPRAFFVRQEGELPALSTHSVGLGRADGDSALDVALAEFQAIRLYRGEVGSPFFFADPPQLLGELFNEPGTAREAVVADLVDLDDDGCLDLFVAENDIQGATAGVYWNACGVGTAEPFPQTGCGGAGQPACAFVAAPAVSNPPPDIDIFWKGVYDARYGDLDADGAREIVTVNQNADNSGNVFSTVVQVLRPSGRDLVDVTSTFMQPFAALEGGMGLELGDLDNDGDPDLVLAGAVLRGPPGGETIRAAATVYENRTFTHIAGRTLPTGTIVGIEELRADGGTEAPAGADVRLESSQRVALGDGFTAAGGATLQVCITGSCS